MSRPTDEFAELRALLDALCEESIIPEQVRRLEELVLARPENEAYYVQYMGQHADLVSQFNVLPVRAEQSAREHLGAGQPEAEPASLALIEMRPPKPLKPPKPLRRPSRRLLWAAAAVGLVGLAAGLLLVFPWRGPNVPAPPKQPPEMIDDTVAVLLQTRAAEWDEVGMPTWAGAPLPPGTLRLKSGFAHIEFYCGAVVILEGPAEFQLISRTEAYCVRGKLRATVPSSAQGFSIGSPAMNLVDRGTEFGLSVGEGNRTEVHVFQGKVELHRPGAPNNAAPHKELTTGQGVRVEERGTVRSIKLNSDKFLTARDLAARAVEETRRRQMDWLAMRAEHRKDPDLLVYYPFQAEHSWSRTLPDEAGELKQPRDGAIVGCSWVTGRWPGKQGLEFKRVSDRVRLKVTGEYESITLAAWVRVDALPNRLNSLFMPDSWDDGEPHWHIRNDGVISLGIQGFGRKGGVHYATPPVITPNRLGEWVHLAVVHDRKDEQMVTHYVNGQAVQQDPINLEIPLVFGDSEIGNWNVTNRRHNHPVRYFSGCIDEFMLFSRPLKAEEIQKLYTRGRPPL